MIVLENFIVVVLILSFVLKLGLNFFCFYEASKGYHESYILKAATMVMIQMIIML